MDRSLAAVTDVMATVPDVLFCIKSVDGRYVSCNRAFARRAGVSAPGEIVGRTAHDLFPRDLADAYDAQDARLVATGHMLTSELEFITDGRGDLGWFLTAKSRWLDDEGQPAGIVVASVDQRAPSRRADPFVGLATAIDLARERATDAITVGELAEAADMSVRGLERAARRVLGLTPKQLIMRVRLEAALVELATTDRPVAAIATACGYYDQSAFARHFRAVVGTSPARYRAEQRPAATDPGD
ncbi:MAG: helix-turn-helix domain-containing protein [Actinomycetota bacterium]